MYLKVKRIMDICFVTLTAPIWIIVFGVLAVAVKCTSKGPIFFKQKRVGINKTFFMMYKFRSMYINAPKDVPTHLLTNPETFITPVGKFLRKYSLDELPQIINIIKGEISLVGPRPALWNQYDLIAERDKWGANSVPVGITGLAQVSGRDELPIKVKARFDGKYAKHISLFLDIYILFKTFFSAIKGSGVKEGGTGAGAA